MPKESKSGTFAPSDMKLIRKAVEKYLDEAVLTDTPESPNPDVKAAANLLHRIGRIG